MKKLLLSATLGVLAFLSSFAGNFNFPQESNYAYGTMVSNRQSAKISNLYQSWKTNFYEENSSKTMARIKFDNADLTVSEGIAYGMLIFVYMENAQNKTQDEFDKLYAYYKNFGRFNGYLMDWKIEKFSNVARTSDCYNNDCSGSASDADLDVAAALIIAHKQWGSTGSVNYIKEAEKLLTYIYDKQVDRNKLIKAGDHWSGPFNPCYFTTASIKLYDVAQKQENFTERRDWATVYTKGHDFLAEASSSKGLYPDWCDANGDPYSGQGYKFSWDACRTPWRVAWDYSWYGSAAMLDESKQTANNFKTTAASAIKADYDINTAVASDNSNNSCFIGGIGAAFMANSTYQTKLDEYYNLLVSKNESYGYYAPTLQLLYALYFSGNAIDPYTNASTEIAPVLLTAEVSALTNGNIALTFSDELGGSMSTSLFTVHVNSGVKSVELVKLQADKKTLILSLAPGSIKAGDNVTVVYNNIIIKGTNGIPVGAFTKAVTNNLVDPNAKVLIDDCEDGDNTNELGGQWYTYDDNTDKGKSTVSPTSAAFTMKGQGYGGSQKSAQITFTLDAGTCTYCPFIGLGFNLKDKGVAMDMTGTTGISFYHKGNGFTPEFALSTIKNSQNFEAPAVPAHSDWTLVTIKWSTLSQPNWGTGNVLVDWDITKMTKVQFKVTNNTGGNSLQIDNIETIGNISSIPVNAAPTVKTVPANIVKNAGFGTNKINTATMFADADGDKLIITASSSKEAVATVAILAGELVITEKSTGISTITVTANDGKGGTVSTSFTFTIEPVAPQTVDLSPATLNMVSGQIQTLQASISPVGATGTFIWYSSNEQVATVSNGIVTAVGVGKASITVTITGRPINKTIPVTVTASAVLPTDVSLSLTKLTLTVGSASQQPVVTLIPSNATSPKLTWSSSNTAVASVDEFGNIKGLTAGTAIISMTTTGANGAITKKIVVTVTGAVSEFEISAKTNTELFPVPVQDRLYIDADETITYVEIYTVNGTKYSAQKYSAEGIDVQNLPKGTCTVVITYLSGATETIKILK